MKTVIYPQCISNIFITSQPGAATRATKIYATLHCNENYYVVCNESDICVICVIKGVVISPRVRLLSLILLTPSAIPRIIKDPDLNSKSWREEVDYSSCVFTSLRYFKWNRPVVKRSWNLDQFSPSRETIHAISPSSTRICAITRRSREKFRMQRTVSTVWSQMANFLVSNDARVQHGSFLGESVLLPVILELLTRRFRTAFYAYASGKFSWRLPEGLWWFLSLREAIRVYNSWKLISLQESLGSS